ncbi:MAG: excinuclease ABC subunit UvrB [Candidatus Magasanikbacteria bacterium]|nr:excinuclease ABC subunit UvrB [Candidatus Magasanikbacteria bacterium]
MEFKLQAPYKPSGDQPKAMVGLISGFSKQEMRQTLLGVTGSGKTFTVANVIQALQTPSLVIAHNKTLAAQLCNEFREFFPDNAVEYFVSYYDYYQPEAYMPGSDTYIEKEAQVNEEIDRLRHACTQALLSRRDVIIVASVSAIYGLGSPTEYEKIVLHLELGQRLDRRTLMEQLVEMQFERNTLEVKRGTFRMRGQVFEIMPVNEERVYRLEITDRIETIEQIDPVSRSVLRSSRGEARDPGLVSQPGTKALADLWFFPAKHYVAGPKARTEAIGRIESELNERLSYFKKQGKVLEHERLKRRVRHDLELIKNLGYCNGIENYSRHFEGRAEGEPPFTLLDYFERAAGRDGFLTVIDESHATIPQIRGMYHGDRARKDTLVEHGFRLPSARDNRPLTFEEFDTKVSKVLYVSATPAEYEIKSSSRVVEQIVRPTGLVDPEVLLKPITGRSFSEKSKKTAGKESLSQVDDVILEIQKTVEKKERVLVTTLSKKMAEDLTEYLKKKKLKVTYLHSDIHTLERISIIHALRKGEIDVIVGVNLLREGLDIPEVSLVAILDADKEGFLRSETSLVQTIGRAARNVNGRVILYADEMTGSIERALGETKRRREIQLVYNREHGISPKTIEKRIRNILAEFGIGDEKGISTDKRMKKRRVEIARLDTLGDERDIKEIIKDKEQKMKEAARGLEFELAALLRDEIRELEARGKVSKMLKTKKRQSRGVRV